MLELNNNRLRKSILPVLLCLPAQTWAQGTEKALEAMFNALIILGTWIVLGLVLLVYLSVKYRSKKLAMAGYVYVGLNFLFGLLLSLKDRGESYSSNSLVNDLSAGFFTGSLIYLILLIVAQRKWKDISTVDAPAEAAESTPDKTKSLGWMRFCILLYLLINLFSEVTNWVTWMHHDFDIPVRLFLIFAVQFLVLAGGLYGLWKKNSWAWVLIVFSGVWYILIGLYQLFDLLFVYQYIEKLPPSVYIRLVIVMLICGSILFICLRPTLLNSFRIEQSKGKRLFWLTLGTALILCLVNILLNTVFNSQ